MLRGKGTINVRLLIAFAAALFSLILVSEPASSQSIARGSFKVSVATVRKVRGVECAFWKGRWIAGKTIKRGRFISYRQQAVNYLAQAKKNTGTTRTRLEAVAGRAALDALAKQRRCMNLENPVVTTTTTAPSTDAGQSALNESKSSSGVGPTTLPVSLSVPSDTTLPTLPDTTLDEPEKPTATTQPSGSGSSPTTTTPPQLEFPTACPSTVDPAWDAHDGTGSGEMVQRLACGESRPLTASGPPIKVGVLSLEGDPIGSFPEYFAGLEAAIKYVNGHLGGVGADSIAGTPGRPIELTKCAALMSSTSAGNCATALVADAPDFVLSTLSFFESPHDIFAAADIAEILGTPLAPKQYSMTNLRIAGQNCVVQSVGMLDYVERVLDKPSVSVMMMWTPSGAACYDIAVVAPADVIAGQVPSLSSRRGSRLGFTQEGVKWLPGKIDTSEEAAKLISSGAEAYVLQSNGMCSEVLSRLIAQGWTNATTPVVMSGSCYDAIALADLGAAADGVVFVGEEDLLLGSRATVLLNKENELREKYKDLYIDDSSYRLRKFSNSGFDLGMRFWQAANKAVETGGFNGDAVLTALDEMVGHTAFGAGRLSCGETKAPYISACDHRVKAFRWSDGKLEPAGEMFSGLGLLDGVAVYDASVPPDRRLL